MFLNKETMRYIHDQGICLGTETYRNNNVSMKMHKYMSFSAQPDLETFSSGDFKGMNQKDNVNLINSLSWYMQYAPVMKFNNMDATHLRTFFYNSTKRIYNLDDMVRIINDSCTSKCALYIDNKCMKTSIPLDILNMENIWYNKDIQMSTNHNHTKSDVGSIVTHMYAFLMNRLVSHYLGIITVYGRTWSSDIYNVFINGATIPPWFEADITKVSTELKDYTGNTYRFADCFAFRVGTKSLEYAVAPVMKDYITYGACVYVRIYDEYDPDTPLYDDNYMINDYMSYSVTSMLAPVHKFISLL